MAVLTPTIPRATAWTSLLRREEVKDAVALSLFIVRLDDAEYLIVAKDSFAARKLVGSTQRERQDCCAIHLGETVASRRERILWTFKALKEKAECDEGHHK